MTKAMKSILLLFMLSIVLTACSSNTEGNSNDSSSDDPSSSEEKADGEPTESEGSSNFEDLGMGDTVDLDTNVGSFKVTLTGAEMKDKVQGEPTQQGTYVITKLKIENTGDEPLKVEDPISSMSLYNDTKESDVAWLLLGDQKEWKGELQPGESSSGELTFDTEKTQNYELALRYVDGEGKTLRWKFSANEMK
ncbi:DUF4352 domain-containing protein [Halobacillus salinarum]|uniref:DUF4352 domain-containing protein n=1 Tax=Halobacillus salinarum TaxID=2932257 RepID=A0ABY4EKP2_9BACI|nr:DUF4352 domain-containing protein [Halobacillus salinarum]UOQ45040.1 DUF4352 domain-containing protein [Halobacillus salinarum]